MAKAKQMAASGPIDGPWALPGDWRWERLEAVGQWGSGGTPNVKTGRYYGGDIPWFRSGELSDGPLRDSEIKITQEGLAGSSAKLIPAGALLIAMYGATVGKLATTTQPCATNQAIAFCVVEVSKLSVKFLFYYLLSIRLHLRDQAQGGAQPNISQTVLKAQLVPFPPIHTQDAIVARIDELFTEIDDGEAALGRTREDLGTWRKALLKAAVTGKLTADWRAAYPPTETGADLLARILIDRRKRWEAEPKNKGKHYVEPDGPDPSLAKIPLGWVWSNVVQVAIVDSGGTPPGIEAASAPTGEVPWFKVSSMSLPGNETELGASRWWLSREQARKANLRIFPAGSLVFPKLGGALLTNKRRRLARDGCLDLNNMAVSCMPGMEEYISILFSGIDLSDLSDGSVVPQLKRQAVEAITFAIPPAPELAEVVTRLRVAFAKADELRDDVSELAMAATTLRQSILAAAFRGELA